MQNRLLSGVFVWSMAKKSNQRMRLVAGEVAAGLVDELLDALDHGFGGDAEMAVELFGGGGGAKTGHADEIADGVEIAIPAQAQGGFNADRTQPAPRT